jgi:hypothetical protein
LGIVCPIDIPVHQDDYNDQPRFTQAIYYLLAFYYIFPSAGSYPAAPDKQGFMPLQVSFCHPVSVGADGGVGPFEADFLHPIPEPVPNRNRFAIIIQGNEV